MTDRHARAVRAGRDDHGEGGDDQKADTRARADRGACDINTVLSNLRVWLAGLLAALATLFLTIGGIRYLLAGGDPAALERAKGSIKAAIIGYALALLAPVLATVVQRVVGG